MDRGGSPKRPDFFLPVRVLSKLFRRLMIEKLIAAHAAGQLTFHGAHAALVNAKAFAAYLAPLKRTRWFVYAKRPFAGPKAVLAYLARYTHRVAISNRRLIAADAKTVTFKVKDYRIEGRGRYKTMTLAAHEFIRRFLIHVLPIRLPPHPPLRSAGERRQGRQPRARPQAARWRSAGARRPSRPRPIRPRPISRARAAVPPCASSRCSRPANSARHRPTAMPATIRIDTS